ncbi:hypothetical protein MKEN_00937200 [Mycena kentingensis (nom. inval.)]|nr:hypothetical protein MKEN_00937200 [Mycena kentingensis (nom. inval.)]
MRFSVPRSLSPSPERRPQTQGRSTYGLNLVDYSDSDESSASEEDPYYDSEPEVAPQPPRARVKITQTPEQRHVDETIAAIRLRTRHHDPYEEWEKQTRKDAFRVARKDHAANQAKQLSERDKAHSQEERRLAAMHTRQLAEVEGLLSSLKIQQQKEEDTLKRTWQERDKALWARIDAGIKVEEDKVRAKLDAERKVREEAERKRAEEEARRKAEEDRKQKEAEEAKRAAEEKERLRVEGEKKKQEDERRQAQEEQDRATRLAAEADGMKSVGLTTSEDDWKAARRILLSLKSDIMKPIKDEKARRSLWGEYRRKITPRIGQLTGDAQAIKDILTFLDTQVMRPNPPHPPMLYTGLCSSLAKAILLQAETEVTAEKKAAIPLAHLTSALLDTLPNFPDVLFAKLVQRCGPWAIPCTLPPTDISGQPWADDDARAKALGYRRSVEDNVPREPVGEYMQRIAGCMRVYFAILRIPPKQNAAAQRHPMFQLTRVWMWFARLLGSERLLDSPVAAQLMYTGLDILGPFALQVWGHQWVKMLELMYIGVTVGFAGKKLIGGSAPDGNAPRMRLKMEVEKVLAGTTDKLDLESFYPFLAYIAAHAHNHEQKPKHPALLHTIHNAPNPDVPPVGLPDGSAARLVVLGDPIQADSGGMSHLRHWFPQAASDAVCRKLFRRIQFEGSNLPILVAICLVILSEIYTTKADLENRTPRIRLAYKSSPIADFGIVAGSVRVTPQDQLAYFNPADPEEILMRGQNPDDHYWLYFDTIRGETVTLDFGMYTFNNCLSVRPPRNFQHDINWAPALFLNREIYKATPYLYTERRRVSFLRSPEMHEVVAYYQ